MDGELIEQLRAENYRLAEENAILRAKLELTLEEKQLHIDGHACEKAQWDASMQSMEKERQKTRIEVQQVLALVTEVKNAVEAPKKKISIMEKELKAKQKRIKELETLHKNKSAEILKTSIISHRSTKKSSKIEVLLSKLEKKQKTLQSRVRKLEREEIYQAETAESECNLRI